MRDGKNIFDRQYEKALFHHYIGVAQLTDEEKEKLQKEQNEIEKFQNKAFGVESPPALFSAEKLPSSL